jgi:hypothetical protein
LRVFRSSIIGVGNQIKVCFSFHQILIKSDSLNSKNLNLEKILNEEIQKRIIAEENRKQDRKGRILAEQVSNWRIRIGIQYLF